MKTTFDKTDTEIEAGCKEYRISQMIYSISLTENICEISLLRIEQKKLWKIIIHDVKHV